MLQVTRQHFQVESGRLLRVMQLEDPDTGASDQQVDVVGQAPPGSREGDTAEYPEDLVKSSPDVGNAYTGGSGDQYGYGNFGNQVAGAMKGIYGGGMPSDQAGGGSPMGERNLSPGAQQFVNGGTPAASGVTGPGQQAGAAPGQPGAGGPVNTQGVSGLASNADTIRGQTLYNETDPTTAINNALMDMGVNPFNSGNPFVSFMQRAAPGLAAAFMIQNALGGATGQSAADTPDAFKNFLGSSLVGGHALSGIAGMASKIPDVVAKIRATAGTGGTAQDQNPYLYELNNLMGSGFGEGTAGILSSLLGPSMNRGLAGGYKSGLEKALTLAQRNYDYNDPKADIWKFLLGS